MKPLLGGFQQDFEKAKRQYPHTMQVLVLAAKQQRWCVRTIPGADVLGLALLGVIELEVGVGEKLVVSLPLDVIPLLKRTTLAELRGYTQTL